ncbi:antigen 5 like allergen Cul n 1-like isoform X2 [Uranotaenia lowii]|uniref:antigen 5 like allergen Cul n 1-like isoform X2 n=1 Tax=Uranotaenia lowii TaxID=190385 RepID=UPI00247A7DD0|nr:antigen 5 like allergen Cul n 1-like isoform X2 [Uranotaenia lowii]
MVLTAVGVLTSNFDYCTHEAELCKNSAAKLHIGCRRHHIFNTECDSEMEHFRMDAGMKVAVLKKHNQLRSEIARGLHGFPTAAKMSALKWDDELGRLSFNHAMQCSLDLNLCRNTVDHPAVGQNLRTFYFTDRFQWPSLEQMMESSIDLWFSERKQAEPDDIRNLTPSKAQSIGHFTQLISDRVESLGCNLVRYRVADWDEFHFVCYYSTENVEGAPVYEMGPTGEKCLSELSPDFVGLCSEVYEDIWKL